MSDKSQFLVEEYRSRINRVMDYIEVNMDRTFKQDELANVANFSKYHFHRIFCSMVGETLGQFIQRVRVEKAATMLINNPKKSITEVAFDCGFSSSAVFARSFKDFFDQSASEWRKNSDVEANSKICKVESNLEQRVRNKRKASETVSWYSGYINNNPLWRIKMKTGLETTVEVRDMEELTLAYVRHIGPYKGDSSLFENLWGKLMKWAGPRELLSRPDVKSLIIYHDNPEVTDDDKLRTSVCISVPEDTQVDGEVGKMNLPAGKYAFGRFEIGPEGFQQAWDFMYGTWLPESGYQPDDRPCFEMYINDGEEHQDGKFVLDICVPVKPL